MIQFSIIKNMSFLNVVFLMMAYFSQWHFSFLVLLFLALSAVFTPLAFSYSHVASVPAAGETAASNLAIKPILATTV